MLCISQMGDLFMKNAPIKILVAIILSGLVCFIGELLLSKQLDELSASHDTIMKEYVTNREYMAEIKSGLYEHQAILVNQLLASNSADKAAYVQAESELRSELTNLIVNFSYRMKGGRSEQIYHLVYSDFAAYRHNADTMLGYCNDGDMNMAIYYNDTILKPFLDDIGTNLKALDDMTLDEINNAEAEIQNLQAQSDFMRNIGLFIIASIILFCSFICVNIAMHLDKYKQSLEDELIEKNKSIQEKNQNIIKLQDGIIIGMANLIESRDGETGEHVKRTSAYVEMIAKQAQKMGIYADQLTDAYIDRLKKAAPLHDVGKITVKDSILMKPGKLTPEEFEEIKMHATKGGMIIRECFSDVAERAYVDMACDVACYHHEKWNGSGYMKGLSGEDIPLSARIMAIADVFDALISKRCYKEAFPIEEAFSIIEHDSGSHFDPKLVEVFLSIRDEITEYSNS